MSEYQWLQLVQAGLCLTALFVLCLYWLVGAMRRGSAASPRRRHPVLGVGVLVAAGAVAGFGGVFAVAGSVGPGEAARVEMVVRLLREVPAVAAVAYACVVQARRYRGAIRRALLRTWFGRAPLVLGGALVFAGVAGVAAPYPILELGEPLPARALWIDAVWLVPLGAYASSAALVFVEAVGQELPGWRARVQNLCAALGMGCISAVVWNALHGSVVRVSQESPSEILARMETIAALQVPLVGVAAVSLALSVVFYFAGDARGRLAERVLRVVEVVGELSELVENAPIARMGLSVEYAAALEAAQCEELLALPEEDAAALDEGFRLALLRARASWSVDRAGHLARVYDAMDGERILDAAPEAEAAERRMREVLGLVGLLEEKGWAAGRGCWRSRPAWAQLCVVALADAGVLGEGGGDDPPKEVGVEGRILDAYRLAKWKVGAARMSAHPLPAARPRSRGLSGPKKSAG